MTVTKRRGTVSPLYTTRGRGWSDNGERYIVSYADGGGLRRPYGYTNSVDEAREWAKKIKENPAWDAVKIRDRGIPNALETPTEAR